MHVSADGGELLDGSSRSQSLTEKRKSDAVEPLTVLEPDEQTVEISQEGLKEAAILEQRAVRRYCTLDLYPYPCSVTSKPLPQHVSLPL